MSLIQVKNVSFSYPGNYDTVFTDISFQLDTNWKLGLVGRNGRGKTTFLNLLLNKYEYSGTIQKSVTMDYFPYPVEDETKATWQILNQICPQAETWELIRELNYLQLRDEVLWRPFSSLSSGEQTKSLLAALFLNEGHFLLIDEPTNHLDLDGRRAVAAYLKRKKGFILVSHDRAFLDGCVDHILALNRRDITLQTGNFSTWMENFERQQAFEQSRETHLKKDIQRLQQSQRQSANWSDRAESTKQGTRNSGLRPDTGYIGHKAAKMMQRSKSLQNRQQQAIAEKSKLLQNAEAVENLKLSCLPYHDNTLIRFKQVQPQYDSTAICQPVHFDICQGQRIALRGSNGSGKSSLLKLLLLQDRYFTGELSIGSQLVISYVDQDTSWLYGNLTDFARERDIDESLLKAILRKMDFSRQQFEKNMAVFSAGQKKKVLIAASLCKPAHIYVWDEPLNFIDIYSRIQIEQLLLEFRPTMLFVEHDAAFQAAIATDIVDIHGLYNT